MQGKLYLCATPIGNLEDMTFRAVRILKEADLIAAEDTRNSIKLLNHFDIHTEMTSYHEYNRIEKAYYLIDQMKQGKTVALITDAGMPGISDPGEDLVRLCREAGVEVTIVPGACACVSALAISGLKTRRFCFEAFLSWEKKERAGILEELKRETRTIVLYEAPHRLKRTLEELAAALGEERQARLCKELTKIHEDVISGTLGELHRLYEEQDPKGEYVLVIEGLDKDAQQAQEQRSWQEMSVREHVQMYLDQGLEKKEAMKEAARDRGVGKREIYKDLLEEEEAGR